MELAKGGLMHSKIFQLSKEPIEKDELMTESYFLSTDCDYTGGGFVGTVADYVSAISEKAQKQEITEFVKAFKNGIEYHEEGNYFVVVDKKEIFKEDFHDFSTTMEGFSIKEFVNKSWANRVKDIISPTFSWYVYTDLCWEPYTDFFRTVKTGEKYYFGSVLDYHC